MAMFKVRRSLFNLVIAVAAFSVIITIMQLQGLGTPNAIDGTALLNGERYVDSPTSQPPTIDIQLPPTSSPTSKPISTLVTRTPTAQKTLPVRAGARKGAATTTTRKPNKPQSLSTRAPRRPRVLPSETPEVLAAKIEAYHRDSEKRCLADYANDTHPDGYYCPCLPTEFRGLTTVNDSTEWSWSDISPVTGADWQVGGEWKPAGCVARYHIAVIIPFRDRDSHLIALLRHLIPQLQRQQIHFRIFVVEQNSPAVFNKACMMNIGFVEASKLFPEVNCIMFQDADSLLEDDRLLMRCDTRPHHYALYISRWGYKMSYGGQFGGVVTIRPNMFRQINGFPITFFGWGGEDDAMGGRVRRVFRTFRPPKELCRYTTLPHKRDGSNPRNHERIRLMSRDSQQHKKNRTTEGITDMSYTIQSIQQRSFYTHIYANLNVSGLPYPHHNESNYTKLDGACPEKFYYQPQELSASTCRFVCDTAPRKRPCFGYTYYPISPEDARLGRTVSTCRLLKETCKPTRRKVRMFTYIRVLTFAPVN